MNKKKFFIITMSFLLSSTHAFTADSPDWYQFVQSLWVESENARADLLQTSKSEQADARVNSLRTSLDENICLLRSDCVKRVNELKATEAVNVQDYLPENPMLDGSVDYLEQIQKALNENRCVKFTGSDDPVHPLIYGMSSELVVPEGHILLGDATAVIRRYQSSGKLITLKKGAATVGLKIDGNKQTHYPHFKDLKKTDCAINMEGNCFVANCYVHSHPGTGIYTFGDFPYNLVYNCTCEDVGYIDLKYDARHYQGSYDQNSADGIYLRAFYNVALDCFVKDAFRWAYTTSHSQGGYCTYINCDAYNTLFKCYGFIDIEGADRECLIIDCDGGHESSLWQDYRNGFWISTNGTKALFCSANFFVSGDDLKKKRGDHITIIGCKTTGSGYGVWGDSPVVVKNLASKTHSCGTLRFDACCRDDDKTCASFYVNALDGTGIAAQNILYEQPDGPGMKITNVRDIQNQCRFIE